MFNSYVITDLQPFTNYSFWVEAENDIGSSVSRKTNITTPEDGKLKIGQTICGHVSSLWRDVFSNEIQVVIKV